MSYIRVDYGGTLAKKKLLRVSNVIFKTSGKNTICILEARVHMHAYGLLKMTLGDGFVDGFKIIGISKCSDKDTYDERIGRNIAEHKAFKQYYSLMKNMYSKMAKYYAQATECAKEYKEWAENKEQLQKNLVNQY